MSFDQLFTWPTDQPRHATGTYGDPVESNRPLSSNKNYGRLTHLNPIGTRSPVNQFSASIWPENADRQIIRKHVPVKYLCQRDGWCFLCLPTRNEVARKSFVNNDLEYSVVIRCTPAAPQKNRRESSGDVANARSLAKLCRTQTTGPLARKV